MKGLTNPNPETRHSLLIDFYMNPNYNYYHNNTEVVG
jgi:hypothetical protein